MNEAGKMAIRKTVLLFAKGDIPSPVESSHRPWWIRPRGLTLARAVVDDVCGQTPRAV